MDTLYFKDPILDKNIKDQTDAIKIIGLTNLFNHNAYAVQLAEYFYKNKVIDKKYYDIIIKNINKNNRPILNSLVGKFEKVISEYHHVHLGNTYKLQIQKNYFKIKDTKLLSKILIQRVFYFFNNIICSWTNF